MNDECEIDKRNDRIIVTVLIISLFIVTGKFFIENSNVIKITELTQNGQTVEAQIISSQQTDHHLELLVTFLLNKQEYKRKLQLNFPESLKENSILLHYLPDSPYKAVHLASLEKSLVKYTIGWIFIIISLILSLTAVYKFLTDKKAP